MNTTKLQRLLGILAKLDMDTQEDLIDEAICFFIDKGVDITIDLEEESEKETAS